MSKNEQLLSLLYGKHEVEFVFSIHRARVIIHTSTQKHGITSMVVAPDKSNNTNLLCFTRDQTGLRTVLKATHVLDQCDILNRTPNRSQR